MTLDLILYAPGNARSLWSATALLIGLKQVAFGTGGGLSARQYRKEQASRRYFGYPIVAVPPGGRRIVNNLMRETANKLAKRPVHASFTFMKLPPDLRSMVIAHVVVDEAMLTIECKWSRTTTPYYWYRTPRCGGFCRGTGMSKFSGYEC